MPQPNEIRYVNRENGVVYFDAMFTEYGCPANVRRERFVGLDENGNEDWRELPNRPMPGIEFQRKGDSEDVDGYVMDFDTPLDPWASDTHSGGPSNFHGNGGGDDNPRVPAVEGEEPGAFEKAMQNYQKASSNA